MSLDTPDRERASFPLSSTPNRSVPPTGALALSYRVVLRQLTSKARIIALTMLALVSTVAGFALGRADADLEAGA